MSKSSEQAKDKEYLNHLRHSCAHLLAAAVMDLWPNTKRAIGPAIENGFYFDFDFEKPMTEEDLPKIEKKMAEILKGWDKFEREEVTAEEAKKRYEHNPYKLELIAEFAKGGQALTFYKSGTYEDLCKGGHCENPEKEIGAFKLLSIAGAYWRGSEKNKMLTRIYGTCFPTKKELEEHLAMLEDAKARDHKKLGKSLELFMFSQNVGPGLPILLPKGFMLRQTMEDYLNKLKKENGLIFVWTPHIARSALYKQSQHWQKYDAMMPPLTVEEDEYTIKPMNCPHHFQIYLFKPRSYRDLPLRLAENATVYRYEKSGEINGLLRVRALTQDDSHWFVPHNLLDQEIDKALSMMQQIYSDFALNEYWARISIRDKNNQDKYIGDPKIWDKAEKELEEGVKKRKIKFQVVEGEAAFYGPKIDIMVKDSLGREWQLTTIQLDFNQPENFDLKYIDSDGSQKRPAILHIAFLGSLDRFMAILIEQHAGAFPTWLAPVQATILPISEKFLNYSQQVEKELDDAGIRVQLDESNDTLQAKIREAAMQKIPYLLIVGGKEEEATSVAVRTREGKDLGSIKIEDFIAKIQGEIDQKK